MRVLVVLVLAVLSGYNASHLYADEPTKTRLDEVTEEITRRAEVVGEKFREAFQQVLHSEQGRKVSDKLKEAGTAVDDYSDQALNKLSPQVKEYIDTTTDKAAEALHSVLFSVFTNLAVVFEKVTPAAKAAANRLIIAYDNYNQVN